MQARHARGGRVARLERRDFSTNTPSSLYTRRGAICKALRTAEVFSTTPLLSPPRTGPLPYHQQMGSANAPWSSSMAEKYPTLLGADTLGV
jgi:hypothetical protein